MANLSLGSTLYGQPKVVKHLLCTNRWATDHTWKNCKSDSKCKIWKKKKNNQFTQREFQQNIIAFNGENSVLSKFFSMWDDPLWCYTCQWKYVQIRQSNELWGPKCGCSNTERPQMHQLHVSGSATKSQQLKDFVRSCTLLTNMLFLLNL